MRPAHKLNCTGLQLWVCPLVNLDVGFSEHLDVSPLEFERGVHRTPTCCTFHFIVGFAIPLC